MLDDIADLMEKVHAAERDAMRKMRVVVCPGEEYQIRALLDDAGYDCLRLRSHPSVLPGTVRIQQVEPLIREEPPAPLTILDTPRRKPLWRRILER